MPRNKYIYWTYKSNRPRRDYADPRILLVKHIGWTKLFGTESQYCIPEPDNYNRAVVSKKPVECVFVEDQVIYKDITKNIWITLMYVPDEQLGEYEAWITRLQPDAYWQHSNAPKLRQRKEPVA
jgi:hypothetical protein